MYPDGGMETTMNAVKMNEQGDVVMVEGMFRSKGTAYTFLIDAGTPFVQTVETFAAANGAAIVEQEDWMGPDFTYVRMPDGSHVRFMLAVQ